ncbi:hypothetical protein [Streptomyces sp. NPDC003393]
MRVRRPDAVSGGTAQVVATQAPNGFEVPTPPAWMRWLPAAYIVFVVVLGLLLPSHWATSFLLIALPTLAAYTLGPGPVLALTVVAIVLEGVIAGVHLHLWEDHHVAAYIATALVGLLGAALAAHRRRQERSLVHNSVAEALMRTLLRPVPHRIGHLLAAALYRPGEVGDATGSFYPLLDRLRHRFAGRPAPGPADVVDFLNTDLPRHTRHFHDDVAVLAIAPNVDPPP